MKREIFVVLGGGLRSPDGASTKLEFQVDLFCLDRYAEPGHLRGSTVIEAFSQRTPAIAMKSELLHFIKGVIPSVWALELIVLLRNNRDGVWTAETAAKELRSNSNYIEELLANFEAAGLASQAGGVYRYSPATDVLEDLIADLESLYHERPVSVITTIVSARRDRLQTFADAFRFRDGLKE